jgi:hypothetical protein
VVSDTVLVKTSLVKAAYADKDYAASLSEFGKPRQLTRSGGWILERSIPGSSSKDAMGCYPLFSCEDWTGLREDLEGIGGDDVIALSLVADPFGDYTAPYLKECFNAKVIPFKEHFVIDLTSSMNDYVSSHHRRYARKGLRELQIERSSTPAGWAGDWGRLYGHLIARHGIRGISAFSPSAFARQLCVPGVHAFRASYQSSVVGMVLWYVRDEVAYYHLGAYDPVGYQMRASFPLFWTAIEYFAGDGLQWLNLGAGAGLSDGDQDGLSHFKRGWATGTRTAYFCGHIFDHGRYGELVHSKNPGPTEYFPAYRKGEFSSSADQSRG